MPAGRPTDEIKVGRRLTDAEIVGIAIDIMDEYQMLDDKKGLKYALEVIAERREKPKEIV